MTTNLGEVIIGGFVDKSGSSPDYDAIEVAIFKNDDVNPTSSEVQTLDYNGSTTASFSIKIYINAELTNYSFKVYGKIGNDRTAIPLPEGTGNEVVAGDVYIIQGQSNAVAFMQNPPDESAQANQNNFIRAFGSTIRSDGLLDQLMWAGGWRVGMQIGLGIPPFAALRDGLEIRVFFAVLCTFKPTSERSEEWDLHASYTKCLDDRLSEMA